MLYIWSTVEAILELLGFSWVSLIALDGALDEGEGGADLRIWA